MENENKQSITITNRKKILIEGVKKLDSFDDKEFSVDTILGHLIIQGTSLTLDGMDMEKGLLSIEGTINSLKYGNGETLNKENILKKLFK